MLAEVGRFVGFVGFVVMAVFVLLLALHALGLRRLNSPREHIAMMIALIVAVAGYLLGGGKLRGPPPP